MVVQITKTVTVRIPSFVPSYCLAWSDGKHLLFLGTIASQEWIKKINRHIKKNLSVTLRTTLMIFVAAMLSSILSHWCQLIRNNLYPNAVGKFKVARANPILSFRFAAFSYFKSSNWKADLFNIIGVTVLGGV